MKKLMTVSMVGAVMALSACASSGEDMDYSYERQAPYADERTASSAPEEAAPVSAERTFEAAQRK